MSKSAITSGYLMTSRFRMKFWFGMIFLLVISSCSESVFDDENFNDDISLMYQKLSSKYGKIGVHDAANEGLDEFYFLFPTVEKQPKFRGSFNGNLSPVIEISDDFDFNSIHQEFSMEEIGENRINVSREGEFYSVQWDTSKSKPRLGKIYRIRIRINYKILGYVDIAIGTNETKIQGAEIQVLYLNETLQIAFRIEEKICPANIEITPKEATVMVSGKQQYDAVVFNYYGEILKDQKVEWSLSDSEIASIDNKGLATGLKYGFSEVTAKSNDVSASAYIFVQEKQDSPRPGRDIVVFNDVNPFFGEGLENPNNQLMVKNLINFSTPGVRNNGSKIWFDCGRSSAHEKENPTPCGDSERYNPMRNLITNEGYILEDISSSAGTLIEIPQEVKVIFLWLPTVHFKLSEINALKKFAEEGGRIIFIGEWDAFYGNDGLEVENQLLINLGAFMRNVGKAVNCGYNTLPASSLRAHPIMRDVTDLTLACASVIELGSNDYPLFYDKSNQFVLAGVAQINTLPISELVAGRSYDYFNSRIKLSLNPNISSGF